MVKQISVRQPPSTHKKTSYTYVYDNESRSGSFLICLMLALFSLVLLITAFLIRRQSR